MVKMFTQLTASKVKTDSVSAVKSQVIYTHQVKHSRELTMYISQW